MSKPYDIVIAGAGLGGLATAAILSRYGFSVCVLEQHFQPGGSIQNFSRHGVVFDTGAHYIGGVDEGQNLNVLLKFLGVWESLHLKKMDEEAYDVFSFLDSGQVFSHAQGFETFREQLLKRFPNENKALTAYIHLLRDIADDFPLFHFRKDKRALFESPYLHTSIAKGLSDLTANRMLQGVLSGNNLLYAGESQRTPLSVHGLIHYSYIESAYRFVDGASQLANALVKVIRQQGGEVRMNAQVVQFHIRNGLVSVLEMADGTCLEGKQFISNMHPTATFRLIDEKYVRKVYRKRMMNLENTCSIFTLYGVFKKQAFPYLNNNQYLYRDHHVWPLDNEKQKDWPQSGLFLTQPMHDQGSYARGFTMMVYMHYDEVKQWADTRIGKRGDAYEQMKTQKIQQVLAFIEEKYPGFKTTVDKVYASTPLTYEDYTATEEGSLYGVVRDANDGLTNLVLPNTKIPNLFFVGQNTVLHGVLGVLIGSLLVSANFVNFDRLIEDVLKKR